MDLIQRGIVTLLKCAVTGQAESLPAGFDIGQAQERINRYGILPAAYEGAVRCGINPKLPPMQAMLRQTYIQSIRDEKQLRAAKAIFAAFEENAIDYMPMKGCNLKYLYPKTALRGMGDADILIRVGQYERIRPVMLALGYEERMETDHVYLWHSADLCVELHKCPAPPDDADYHGYYGDGWRFAVKGEGYRYDMTAEDAYVFQFTHFARHYRYSGIGCRHMLDLFVYRRSYPEMDEKRIRKELEKLGLWTFHENVMRTLDVWFANAEEDAVTDLISNFIFQSGNWGTEESLYLLQQVKLSKKNGTVRGSRGQNLFSAVFPPLYYMRRQYPILRKAPVLLPVMWPVRIVDILLFRRRSISKRYRIAGMISDDKVELYRQALEAVGLDVG